MVDLALFVDERDNKELVDPLSERTVKASIDLRSKSAKPIFYLPPLLSRLPSQAELPPTKEPFDFAKPEVGYTDSLLPTIDLASWHLHEALHDFRPVSEEYAHSRYREAFNWTDLRLPASIEREWFVIAFRSQRKLSVASVDLYEADRQAHEEAVGSGGLLLYWYGCVNLDGANLATCIWRSRAAALKSVQGPKHIVAMSLAAGKYASCCSKPSH